MPDRSTDAIAALQAVEDWWLSQPGHQRDHGAPACIFMVREVLARHRRTAAAAAPLHPEAEWCLREARAQLAASGDPGLLASIDAALAPRNPPIFVANGDSEGAER